MTNVPITYAGVDYLDRTRPLLDGTVQPEGISLTVVSFQEPSALFRRVAQATEFNAAEMSWSTYAHLLSRGDDRYIAIPFFPSRHFRHGDIYVHRDSGIAHPTDLRGQKVGIPQYRMTAGVWQRAFLQHDYGVLPGEIHWYMGGLTAPGGVEPNAVPHVPGVTIEVIPHTTSLERLLADGEVPVLCSPDGRPAALVDGSGRVGRLFANYRDVEQAYYRRTGFFPIMHLVVVRRALYQAHPWVAGSLLRALVQAQRIGWERLQRPGTAQILLPWVMAELEATTALMGPNHWPQGLGANYAVLDALCQYHHEQGLSAWRLRPEELFAPETHEMPLES